MTCRIARMPFVLQDDGVVYLPDEQFERACEAAARRLFFETPPPTIPCLVAEVLRTLQRTPEEIEARIRELNTQLFVEG
jgi:hypothetical protein